MKVNVVATLLTAASLAQAGPARPVKRAVDPIVVRGNAFYKGDERFLVRGMDYQPGGSAANLDPLADPKICLRDLEYFKELDINTIRVYSTDNSKDHKECMDAFAAAGIYLVLDVNNPLYSINRDKPAPSYNADYLQSIFATMDEFTKYDNTMAFFSGNEVIHDHANTTLAAPFVKAVTRDMKSYQAKRGIRKVLIGYSAADVSSNRMQTAQYFNCGTDDERSDFFAFNDYSWCSTDIKTSGWDVKVKNFTDYGVPIFLSEYGCNLNVRDFGEVKALMGPEMTGVYSGGMMYEYTYEENKYGIVKINGDSVEKLQPEYDNFKKAMLDNPAPTDLAGAATESHAAASCPPTDDHWMVSKTTLPAFPTDAAKYFTEGAGAGPGLNGPGSQNNGPPEVEEAEQGSGFGTGGSGESTGGSGNSSGSDGDSAGVSVQGSMLATASMVLFTVFGTLLM